MVNKNEYESGTYWDQLSTEQLEDILRADIASPNQTNDETVFHILEVLEKREKENPSGRLPDTDQAWQEFQKYYNIPEGEGESLYPIRNTQEKRSASVPTKTRHVFRPRKILVVAAVLILMFGGMLTAQAAGVDVFGAIGRWTEETFHFDIVQDNDRTSLFQETATQAKIPQDFVPTWVPDGFEGAEPQVDTVENYMTSIICVYSNQEKTYSVDIEHYYNKAYIETLVIEKDDTNVCSYESNGKTFYIMSDMEYLTATWTDGTFVETISGQLSMDEIKTIIDSIGG